MRAHGDKNEMHGSYAASRPARPTTTGPLAELQRMAGNAAVTRALRSGSLPFSAGLGHVAAGASATRPVQLVADADAGASAAAAATTYRLQIQVSKSTNSYDPTYWAGRFGHAWVALYTTENGAERAKTFGFFPAEDVRDGNPLRTVKGCVYKNHDRPEKASSKFTADLTPDQYQRAMAYIDENHDHPYSLTRYNCTSFARGVYAAATGGTAPNRFGIPLDNPNLLQDGIKKNNQSAGKPRRGEHIDAPLVDSSAPESDSEEITPRPPEGGLVAIPGMMLPHAAPQDDRPVID
ncbi:hypothetical protein ABZ532_27635 [Streptomyces sp. NPDC019396]|uniref:hypothetical protein n=1 Tax=Streptomyces sp. NPDC019396 TaxID=3154687 RepID=UPI003411A8A0